MKLLVAAACTILAAQGVGAVYAQFGSGHKSEAEIARMTPEQRVEEYCREHARHGVSHDAYRGVLNRHLGRDGLKAVPQLAKIVGEHDPLQHEGKEKTECFDASWILLADMDETVVRLRASKEGRSGIEALRKVVGRMKDARFDSVDTWQYNRQGLYQLCLAELKAMETISRCDESVRATLRIKYKISLTDAELSDFTNYLISQDPYYPSWSEREEYKDLTQYNEAGNPIWYLIMKKPERFYNAYLQYKAKSA